MVRTATHKYVQRYPDGPNELWDLVNDPGERHNLIADPGQAPLVRELRALLAAWFARYVNPDIDGLAQGVTGLGQLHPAFPGWESKGPAYHR